MGCGDFPCRQSCNTGERRARKPTGGEGGVLKKTKSFSFLYFSPLRLFCFGGGHRFVTFLGGSFFSSMVVLALGVLFLFVSDPH